MSIIVPLAPQEEAELNALARKKGTTAGALAYEAVVTLLANAHQASPKEPTRSLRGLLAKYGPAPSAQEIDQNRADMFSNFPHADF